MKRFKDADSFIEENKEWQDILKRLREIVLNTALEEGIKWGFPVYTFSGKNVVGLGSFKSYAGLWFFQGGLLKDEHKKLINAQEGKNQSHATMAFFQY